MLMVWPVCLVEFVLMCLQEMALMLVLEDLEAADLLLSSHEDIDC